MKRKTYVMAIGLLLTATYAGCTKPIQNTASTPINVPIETITPTNTLVPTAINPPKPTAELTMKPTVIPMPTIVAEDSMETKKQRN